MKCRIFFWSLLAVASIGRSEETTLDIGEPPAGITPAPYMAPDQIIGTLPDKFCGDLKVKIIRVADAHVLPTTSIEVCLNNPGFVTGKCEYFRGEQERNICGDYLKSPTVLEFSTPHYSYKNLASEVYVVTTWRKYPGYLGTYFLEASIHYELYELFTFRLANILNANKSLLPVSFSNIILEGYREPYHTSLSASAYIKNPGDDWRDDDTFVLLHGAKAIGYDDQGREYFLEIVGRPKTR